MEKVKVVCTLGPATAGKEILVQLIEAGMDAARLNFSHGSHDDHRRLFQDVRAASLQTGRPVAVLADLSGPKIRVGNMADGVMDLGEETQVVLTAVDLLGRDGRIPHNYPSLARDVRPGQPILLDDGMLELEVTAVEHQEVFCRVKVGGPLKDHKGMNLPGSELSVPALTEKDKKDIALGRELGVDYFALSFVRTAADVKAAQQLAGDIPVIAKIEKPEAVDNLDEILEVSDGVMVARGDLGVELGHEKVPPVQKRILNDIRVRHKPVITATQMLDSMVHHPRPTRAEVSDVANAVLDGTDAVMLSAETSVGKYPIETVRTMNAIIHEVESSPQFSTCFSGSPEITDQTYTNAIASGAAQVAHSLGLAAIAVYSESGRTAQLVSAHRPEANIICFSRHKRVLDRLALCWGVRPLFGQWVQGPAAVLEQAQRELLAHQLVKPGDDIAVTFGMLLQNVPFQTNTLMLCKVPEAKTATTAAQP